MLNKACLLTPAQVKVLVSLKDTLPFVSMCNIINDIKNKALSPLNMVDK